MTMDTIENRIMNAAMCFEMKTGMKPTAVYLGFRENQILEHWLREMFLIVGRPGRHDKPQRREFNGLKVYRVDAEDHLEVSA